MSPADPPRPDPHCPEPPRPGAGGPALNGPRLCLRPLTVEALGALLGGDRAGAQRATGAVFPDPLAAPPLEEGALSRMRDRLAASPAELGWWAWLAVDRATGAAVGSPALSGPPDADGTVEFGYATYPEFVGRGYAVEGGRLLLDWVFEDPRVRRVLAVVPPAHDASVGVARRLGLSVIGRAHDEEAGELLLLERARADHPTGPSARR
ncbi:GNAT family N-acetyltransferase [Parafrankia discariae]|uniref:GNAT family N-acetyltransferase n=1 Tax=Parafrankia discariae TaxID=365528 RepID=UPI00035D6715|nr:GNAT family N-acetyltransferase [Parafrankia discariae]